MIAEYSADELQALAKVFVEEDVRVVVDASFDKIVPPYTPLGAVVVEADGKQHRLYDRVMTITGVSKSFMAFGPLKIGVVCCGDEVWRNTIRTQATLTSQRESTALAAIALEYVDDANVDFAEKLSDAVNFIETINAARARPILQVVGEAKYGPLPDTPPDRPPPRESGYSMGT